MSPTSPPHPCNRVGCAELVPRGQRFCTTHEREAAKNYDKNHRPDHHHLYHSTSWRKLRKAHLVIEPFCRVCGQLGTLVDHIEEHGGDRDLFFDAANLQTMCAPCHNRKHPRGWGRKLFKINSL